jgi:DnaJ-class molecular chaperone
VEDPYKILGVAPSASVEEIRRAYRALAKKWHPDTNPDKPGAEARFKEISAAHALLSDAEQRARFDRGEIDASGAERAPPGPGPGAGAWRDWAETGRGARYRSSPGGDGASPFDEADLEEFLARAFRAQGGGRGGRGGGPARGADLPAALRVSFLDAARGAVREVSLPDGREVRLTIPAGVEDGSILRLAGQGMPGEAGGPPGDLLAQIQVEPHRFFRREGDDILLDLPVTLREVVLGAKLTVPTIEGPVSLTIPPRSANGARLRLRGRGIKGGHQFVVLRLLAPTGPEPELEAFLKGWTPRDTTDPRAGMGLP